MNIVQPMFGAVSVVAWKLQRVSGCVYAMFFGRGAMEIVIVIVGVCKISG